MPRKILVTTALPYANTRMHLGNIVGFVQTDIWTRFQKMCGNDCIYICGSDCHGTPIMISAEKEGVTPETFIKKIHEGHIKDFEGFYVDFDNYYTTHSEENRELSELFYNKLKKKGDIVTKTIEQAYDPVKNMFLPDRLVKGECPKCGAKDQYGDNCEVCGATYSPIDLKNPYSTISGATPITKTSEHYFFQLPNYEQFLKKWIHEGHIQEQIANKLDEWFKEGLQDWDISRDAPYFGFEIPDTKYKYFYCWLDAPIGYIASFKNLCSKRKDLNFDEYWQQDSEIELYHFIGKDIFYFHTLFWPAVLKGVDFKLPNAIFVHGFLTVKGQKLSKSRGTFINACSYLEHLDPEYIRYYYASKLSSRVEDIDLNLEDFRLKVNSDLVGKVINIASRCASFINKYFDGKLSDELTEKDLFEKFATKYDIIKNDYENREYSHAVREIMALADIANQYIDEHKPWQLAKEENKLPEVQNICTMGLNLFRILMIYLKPILPKVSEKTEDFLNIKPLSFKDIKTPLINHKINEFKPLMLRIEIENIEALKEASKI